MTVGRQKHRIGGPQPTVETDLNDYDLGIADMWSTYPARRAAYWRTPAAVPVVCRKIRDPHPTLGPTTLHGKQVLPTEPAIANRSVPVALVRIHYEVRRERSRECELTTVIDPVAILIGVRQFTGTFAPTDANALLTRTCKRGLTVYAEDGLGDACRA